MQKLVKCNMCGNVIKFTNEGFPKCEFCNKNASWQCIDGHHRCINHFNEWWQKRNKKWWQIWKK